MDSQHQSTGGRVQNFKYMSVIKQARKYDFPNKPNGGQYFSNMGDDIKSKNTIKGLQMVRCSAPSKF